MDLETAISEKKFRQIETVIFQQPQKIETVDDFLKRGGKIHVVSDRDNPTPEKKENIAMAAKAAAKKEVPKTAPPSPDEKLKAREAAEKYNATPHIPVAEIIAMIPEYGTPLHRNQWAATFLKHIKPEFSEKISAELKAAINPPKK